MSHGPLERRTSVDKFQNKFSICMHSGEDAEGETNDQVTASTPEQMEGYAQTCDEALKMYDKNNDGYVSYQEFSFVMRSHSQGSGSST